MMRAAYPRATQALLLGVTGVVMVVVVLFGVVGNSTTTHPSRPAASERIDRARRPPSARQLALQELLALTEQHAPLRDYVRQTSAPGACAQVTPGHSPVQVITSVLKGAVPRFHVKDVGRTLDQFTDLCALQLRATGPGGSVLGLVIASPDAKSRTAPFVRTGRDAGPPPAAYVQLRNRGGWTVLLGTTGNRGSTADRLRLRSIANNPKLTW